ncbi:mRNA triphosphatase CET1 [Eremomyces bilateralis CBS 781.70]|uniref:mRNA-capping enzyme subunit beta n=1 Tax=Eremomyces bilateralis CBS 781.70 TaxID=1392243 RepID=A0A6G1G8E0_9PEZI|nr:mRNA triphosphatase CET1 [Eremomyces bilateralis CBS 781.70]KAF1814375.1 mRNA triphosphatase CET1 [Eremomyces bilateralis CBS 781.70]
MKHEKISVDRSPAPPAAPPPNGHPPPLRDAKPGLPEPTVTNFEPYNEFDRKIADFLFDTVVAGPDLGHPSAGGPRAVFEIEAKIGTLVSRDDGGRIALPVQSETILVPGVSTRFESTMSKLQHRDMNRFLNRETQLSQQPPRIPVHYRHSVEVDTFHPLRPAALDQLPAYARDLISMRKHAPKIRVTRDTKTNQVTAKIVKARIADLDIFCPGQIFDIRISVNVEMRYDGPIETLVDGGDPMHVGANGNPGGQPPRRKDRLSYEHQGVRIDLTQVGDPRDPSCTHELEVEVDAEEVRRQGLMAQEGVENSFEPLVKRFLDNVRVLVRAGNPPSK